MKEVNDSRSSQARSWTSLQNTSLSESLTDTDFEAARDEIDENELQIQAVSFGSSEETDMSEGFTDAETCAHSDVAMNDVDSDSTQIVRYHKNGPANTIILAVMGTMVTGKSSFIKTLTGSDIMVGHDLEPCKLSLSLA